MDTSLSHNSQNFNKKLNILELFFQETVNKNFYQKLKFLDEPLPYILGGKDLIKLGLKPGILFGKILKEIYDKQLNGEIQTKEEAIEFVKENFIR